MLKVGMVGWATIDKVSRAPTPLNIQQADQEASNWHDGMKDGMLDDHFPMRQNIKG